MPESIERTLDALERQRGFEDTEVILSDGTPSGLDRRLCERYPWLRLLRPEGATLPVLKGEAIRAARADVVAILDPWDVPEPGWIDAIHEGFGPQGAGATATGIGGVVLPGGPPSPGNRAAYLFEYGAFNPPVDEGPTEGDLPGNNVAYRRPALTEECADVLAREGFNKPFFHERIRQRGGSLVICPEMRVRHLTRYRFLAVAVRRFHYGRCFGATRWRRSPRGRRLLYLVFAPAVPPLLMARHLRRALTVPQNRRLLRGAVAALLGVCLFWGVGEWLGYWLGPGRSCEMFY